MPPVLSPRLVTLLDANRIDAESFADFLEWALSEQLIATVLSRLDPATLGRPTARLEVRDLVRALTGRKWSHHDEEAIFARVVEARTPHARWPIPYGEYLKLLWQVEFKCVICGKAPPDVVLHVDHIHPASKGGASTRDNLQFLCGPHNLAKSDKRSRNPWLDLA